MSRRAWMWIGIPAGLLVAIFVAGFVLEERASADAGAFCRRFAKGSPMADAAAAAREAGEPRLRKIAADEILVGYVGASQLSRHMCRVSGQAGKVVDTEYFFID